MTRLKTLRNKQQRGLTLIDVMIVITIVGILISQAAPSWRDAFRNKRLIGTAETVAMALNLARSETVARNQSVAFSVLQTPAGASCHLVHTGQSDECRCSDSGTAACQPGTTLILASVLDPSVRVDLGSGPSIRFEPRNGTATPTGTVYVRHGGLEIQNRVAITGRVRTCSVSGQPAGVAACPR